MNDEQGHRAGDELIVRAAGTIAGIFAEDAYRVGGDEFVVILLDVSREDFAHKTEQLRRQMQENSVDASIGGVWQASTENLENLLRRADENMYREKKRYYSQADAAQNRKADRPARTKDEEIRQRYSILLTLCYRRVNDFHLN